MKSYVMSVRELYATPIITCALTSAVQHTTTYRYAKAIAIKVRSRDETRAPQSRLTEERTRPAGLLVHARMQPTTTAVLPCTLRTRLTGRCSSRLCAHSLTHSRGARRIVPHRAAPRHRTRTVSHVRHLPTCYEMTQLAAASSRGSCARNRICSSSLLSAISRPNCGRCMHLYVIT